MLTRYLLAALAASVLALAGLGWLLRSSYITNGKQAVQLKALSEAAKAAQARAVKDRAISSQLAQDRAAMARESASLRQALDRALESNRDWANSSVPQEVQDALVKP